MVVIFVIGILMKLFDTGENSHMILLIRSLQLVLHLPILQVIFPQIVMSIHEIIIQIA